MASNGEEEVNNMTTEITIVNDDEIVDSSILDLPVKKNDEIEDKEEKEENVEEEEEEANVFALDWYRNPPSTKKNKKKDLVVVENNLLAEEEVVLQDIQNLIETEQHVSPTKNNITATDDAAATGNGNGGEIFFDDDDNYNNNTTTSDILIDENGMHLSVLSPPVIQEILPTTPTKQEEEEELLVSVSPEIKELCATSSAVFSPPHAATAAGEKPFVEVPLVDLNGNYDEEEGVDGMEEQPFDETPGNYGLVTPLVATGISLLERWSILQPSIQVHDAFEDEPNNHNHQGNNYYSSSPLKNLWKLSTATKTPHKDSLTTKGEGGGTTPETVDSPTDEKGDLESQFETVELVSDLEQRFSSRVINNMEDEIIMFQGEGDFLCNRKYLTILLILLVITLIGILIVIIGLARQQVEPTNQGPGKFFELAPEHPAHDTRFGDV